MFFSKLFTGLLAISASTSVRGESILNGFKEPRAQFRPKFRYWLPDASADERYVRDDVRSMADAGAGGFEFLPYYQFGKPATDWSEYGYGTTAFHPLFRAAMEAAEEQNILMDFAVGANQGQGVPAPPGTPGLAVHLAYANFTVARGQSFDGTLPLSKQPSQASLEYFMHPLEDFGPQKLIVVLAVETILGEADEVETGGNTSQTSHTEIRQIIDLTSSVDSESKHLTWVAPANSTSPSSWRIMAWYERYTNQRSINAGEDPTSFLQNGSWIVDHFSAAGSQIMTDFFDNHVVPDPDDKALLSKVGKYAWEDSMEMNAGVWWTSGFEEKFLDSLGYDIRTCLPFLLIQDNSWAQQVIPYGEEFRSVNHTQSDKCVDDYRLILQKGYEEYVKAHVKWARKRGLEYSNQPAYNLPLSAVNSVLLLDGPEVESFGFNDKIDSYKLFSGPEHLAGNPVLSSECGAAPSLSYTQKLGELLRSVHRGLAGGVSMNVFHGFPYSGPFANTTWPGTTIFAYRFTEMWGPRQPAWKLISPFLDYVSRNQFVLQSGIPKVDLAFYAYGVPYENSDGYESDNLYRLGYTYDYLGPASLESESALVADGVLAGDGPAYKAIVFSNQTKITQAAAAKLHEFARKGLPIIFVGNLTLAGVGMNASASVEVAAMLSNLTSANFPNIRRIPSADGLVVTLQSLNIKPRAALPSDGSTTEWYSFWRSLPEGEVTWLYNGETEGKARKTVEFVFSGVQGLVPYSLNAWTGNMSAVLQYKVNGDSIVMPVTLGPEESTLIFFRKENLSAPHIPVVESLTGSVAGLSTRIGVDGSSSLVALIKTGPGEVVFSNGTSIQLNGSAPPDSELEYWDVIVEDWHRTQNRTGIRTAVTVHEYSKTALLSWIRLDPANLTNVSGLGHYSTSFTAPSAASERALGAILHLAPQGDSLTITINGVVLPSTSYVGDTVMDITNHVNWPTEPSPGTNVLQIDVATTLFNRLRSETNETWSMGTVPDNQLYSARKYENYGLKGPVWIEWVELVEIV